MKEGSNKQRKKRKGTKRKKAGKHIELKLIMTPATEEQGSSVNIFTLFPLSSFGTRDAIELNPGRPTAWKEKAINIMITSDKRRFLSNQHFTNEVTSHENFSMFPNKN